METAETRAYLLLTATGAMLALTNHNLTTEPEILDELSRGGPDKFIAYELPIDTVKNNYRAHFEHMVNDPGRKSEYTILDNDGRQIFNNISLKDIQNQIVYERGKPVRVI